LALLGRAVRPFFQHRIRPSSRGHRPKVPEVRAHWPRLSASSALPVWKRSPGMSADCSAGTEQLSAAHRRASPPGRQPLQANRVATVGPMRSQSGTKGPGRGSGDPRSSGRRLWSLWRGVDDEQGHPRACAPHDRVAGRRPCGHRGVLGSLLALAAEPPPTYRGGCLTGQGPLVIGSPAQLIGPGRRGCPPGREWVWSGWTRRRACVHSWRARSRRGRAWSVGSCCHAAR
jgi:hypothetical protein